MKTVGIVLLILIVILYVVVLPLAKKKYQQKELLNMQSFFNDLSIGDQVMLNSGIIGKIKKIDSHIVHLAIAKDTIIRVDKHSLIGRYNDEN
ncbi:preprotein translocase subunit YajC [Vagococcus sp. JNUCC 83]